MYDLTEFNKLELYLKNNHYEYERTDKEGDYEEHQLIVYKHKVRDWDAICSYGSFGHNSGLLEIMGAVVFAEDGDSIVGNLTANDVIKRLNKI